MPSHSISFVWSNGGSNLTGTATQTAPAEINVDTVVAPGTTNQEIDVLINVAQLKSIYLTCNVPIKITTNSPVANETIYLNSAPAAWTSAGSQTMIFTSNAAKFYATTASSISTATLSMRCLTQAASF